MEQKVPRGAYLVWSVGVLAYVMAVFNRTSFGVAVIPAAARFDASASTLASFSVVQLIVYAGLQIPVGIVLDRAGPRRLIIGGAVLMAVGQGGLAVAHTVPLALVMRVLIGAGDAVTFVSVLRVVTEIFPGPRIPVFTQLTGLFGQLGGLLSAVPLVAMLGDLGWERSFGSLAALGALVGILVVVALRVPEYDHSAQHVSGQAWQKVKGAFKHPGTRLGLWSHFTSQFSTTVFTMLWGFPFLISAEGQSRGMASLLLSLNVAASVLVSPLLGRLVARHPLRRSWLVLGVIGVGIAGWTLVLAWPGRAPLWVLIAMVLAIATGGPGSMIGFDYARTFNPRERIGTATGIVNVGGFTASLLLMYLMGVVLDLVDPSHGSGGYSLTAFRWAFSVQYLFWGFGIVAIVLTRRKVIERERLVIPPMAQAVAREYRLRRQRRGKP